MSRRAGRAMEIGGALVLGVIAGALCEAARIPLPWMLGPLTAMAVARWCHVPLALAPGGRHAGQLVIGVALGLYFTPEVGRQVLVYGGWMVALGLAAIGIGGVCARVLSRLAGVDAATAFFASVPGGAAEMAVLGRRYGASVPHVALAHCVRILLVVVIVPGGLAAAGVMGSDTYAPGPSAVRPEGLALLLVGAFAAALLAQRARVPNAWVMGPLSLSVGLTLAGVHLSAIPGWLSALGQLLIGIALGERFAPDFLRAAPRFALALLVSVAVALVLAAALGIVLAEHSGLGLPAMILAAAPGGIAEMCITAKVLHLAVPVVTAFHVVRFVLVVTLSGPLFHLARSLARAG